jgi:hypothetical protein
MKDPQYWRVTALEMGIGILVLNALYWVISVWLMRNYHFSSNTWGYFISCGILAGLTSLVCGLIGKGSGRWAVVIVACGETFFWWLMAVGG